MVTQPRGAQKAGWISGIRLGLLLAPGGVALAISFGAYAVTSGWPAWLVITMSALVFSGTAQFALVTAMAGGGGAFAGIAAAALLNARFIPMAAAVARHLSGGPLRRALEGQAVVDLSFVGSQRGDGSFDREKLLGAAVAQWPLWVGGTAVGAVFAPSPELLSVLGLDVVFPCFFLLLLLDILRSRPGLIAVAVVACGIAVAALTVAPAGVALILCALAALLGALRASAPPATDVRGEPLP